MGMGSRGRRIRGRRDPRPKENRTSVEIPCEMERMAGSSQYLGTQEASYELGVRGAGTLPGGCVHQALKIFLLTTLTTETHIYTTFFYQHSPRTTKTGGF